MLMLLFRVGKERYALDTTLVVEVIPKVDLIKYHGTQPAIAGRFNYQGRIVPVLDLSQFLAGEPCPAVLSTRIVIVDLDIRQPRKQLLGLMVEKATETLTGDRVSPVEDTFPLSQHSYLGEVLLQDRQIVQCLQVDRLLSENWENLANPRELLAAESEEVLG